jgi:Tol biopolymer transport system component
VYATAQFSGTGEEIAQYHGGSVTDLSGTGLSDQMPSVSNDGSHIAYQSTGHTDVGQDGLYVMNSDGSGATQVTQPVPTSSSPSVTDQLSPSAWNQTGTKLVFERQGSNSDGPWYEIRTVNADGSGLSNPLAITTGGSGQILGIPAWSANGSYIAYSYCPSGSTCHIYVMNADGRARPRSSSHAEYGAALSTVKWLLN